MTAIQLSIPANACVKLMHLEPSEEMVISATIKKYSTPSSCMEYLYWIFYRVVQGLKSLCCASDWQKATALVVKSWVTLYENQGVFSPTPKDSKEAEFKKAYMTTQFPKMANSFLQETLRIQNKGNKAQTSDAEALKALDVKGVLLETARISRNLLYTS